MSGFQTILRLIEKKHLDYYPYFGWQRENPKKFIKEFLTSYIAQPEEKTIFNEARIATMGSCFAQYIAKPLIQKGADVLVLPNDETNNNAPAIEFIFSMDYKIDHTNGAIKIKYNNES